VVDQRRLADAGLAGDEDDLPASRGGPLGGRVELRERRVAADQRRADGIGGRLARCLRGERADPSIAATVERLDEARLAGVVAERLAEVADRHAQDGVDDVRIRPQRVEQRVLGHELARAREQVLEQAKRVARQLDAPVTQPEALVDPIEAWKRARGGRHRWPRPTDQLFRRICPR